MKDSESWGSEMTERKEERDEERKNGVGEGDTVIFVGRNSREISPQK